MDGKSWAYEGFKNFITLFILFSGFIPISLYVTLELVKAVQARWFIEPDLDMYYPENDMSAKVRSSSLNEELGYVDFIFSDKTGTLTQNKMRLIAFKIDSELYGDLNQMKNASGASFYDERMMNGVWTSSESKSKIEQFLHCTMLCNSVLPELNKENGKKICALTFCSNFV